MVKKCRVGIMFYYDVCGFPHADFGIIHTMKGSV